MKRTWSVLLLWVLAVVFLTTVPANAAGTIEFEVTGTSNNDTITVSLAINQNRTYSGQIAVAYDTKALTLQKVEEKEAMSDVLVEVNTKSTDTSYPIAISFAGVKPVKSGTMMEFTFQIKDGAKKSDYLFGFQVKELNDMNATSVLQQVKDTTVEYVVTPSVAPSIQPTVTPTQSPTPTVVAKVEKVKTVTSTTNSLTIKWDPLEDVAGYEVTYSVNDQWKTKTVTTNTLTQTNIKVAMARTYKVRGYKMINGKKVYGEYSTPLKTSTRPDVTKLKVASTTNSSVKLSWNPLKRVSGYVVKVYKDGKLVTKKEVSASKTSTTISNLSSNTKYSFRISGYIKAGEKRYSGANSKSVSTTTKLSKTTITSITSKKRKATINWKKTSGVSGYKVYMSTSKNSGYKLLSTISKKSKTSYTTSNLTKGKTYYFKLRTYKVVNGKTKYSEYTPVKSIKIK